jgi:hypothetical protein
MSTTLTIRCNQIENFKDLSPSQQQEIIDKVVREYSRYRGSETVKIVTSVAYQAVYDYIDENDADFTNDIVYLLGIFWDLDVYEDYLPNLPNIDFDQPQRLTEYYSKLKLLDELVCHTYKDQGTSFIITPMIDEDGDNIYVVFRELADIDTIPDRDCDICLKLVEALCLEKQLEGLLVKTDGDITYDTDGIKDKIFRLKTEFSDSLK